MVPKEPFAFFTSCSILVMIKGSKKQTYWSLQDLRLALKPLKFRQDGIKPVAQLFSLQALATIKTQVWKKRQLQQ
jgi:hypothetical protein